MCCIKSGCKGTAFAILCKTFLKKYLICGTKNSCCASFCDTQASFLASKRLHIGFFRTMTACHSIGSHTPFPCSATTAKRHAPMSRHRSFTKDKTLKIVKNRDAHFNKIRLKGDCPWMGIFNGIGKT